VTKGIFVQGNFRAREFWCKGVLVMECFAEPTLDEVLSDPMVMEVMASDGVDPAELETALVEIATDIRTRKRQIPA
jgi:hypothetical protein